MPARIGLAALWLVRFLPLAMVARLGAAFGALLHALAGERRRICLANLERCLPELAPSERSALARAHFRAYGRGLAERSILWWAPRRRVMRFVRIAGREHLDAAGPGPLILLAPHFIALDAGWSRLACERDMASIYARQKSRTLDAALLRGRLRFGSQRLYSRQDGIRAAIAALRDGLALYYLPDQDYGARDSVFVPFFGVQAATITALPRLARIAGARIVPCVTRMLAPGEGCELRCYPAWENFPTADPAADLRRMNAFIEERVREMPEQYFWTHKRFKTRPEGEPPWY